MAQQRGKDGKYSGAGGQSMENFVKMRENPGSVATVDKDQPNKVWNRNVDVAYSHEIDSNNNPDIDKRGKLRDYAASTAKKEARNNGKIVRAAKDFLRGDKPDFRVVGKRVKGVK